MIDIKKKHILRPLPKVSVSDGLKNPTIVGKASSPKASSPKTPSAKASSPKTSISKASSPKASSPKTPSAKASSPKISIPEKVQKTNFFLERYKIFMENRKKQTIKRRLNKQNKELLKQLSDSSSDSSK
jgi:hypothetical protein